MIMKYSLPGKVNKYLFAVHHVPIRFEDQYIQIEQSSGLGYVVKYSYARYTELIS